MYRQSEKNLLSSNTSSTCPNNMVNFGPVAAEICWRVWGTPVNFNRFVSWQRYCTASSSGRQPNFAALNRGRHLCSAGQPSGWALAHILVTAYSVLCYLLPTVSDKQGCCGALQAMTSGPVGNITHGAIVDIRLCTRCTICCHCKCRQILLDFTRD